MAFLDRDGRLRGGTLWVVFVVALLLGGALGWAYRWWSQRSLEERAHEAAQQVKGAVERSTR
jgi:predicted negative regulator of RcsB-dependent stress response